MKFLKITAAILSLALLTACNSAQSVQTSETVSESEMSAVTTAAETTAKTETQTEPAEIAEENEIEYVEVSPNNEFIDFEFIEDYQGTTDIGDLADKAVEHLKTTDEYAESMKNISEFTDVEFSDYISDGVIVPKFRAAYPNDYDGDGRTETFIAVDMPVRYYYNNVLTSFYIYADSSENMTLLSVSGRPDENAVFLNYGRDKQIAFGGSLSPYGSICYLYGVKDGEPVLLYSEQAGLEKRSCFLRSHGFQATERFMYYDTVTRKYRQIASVQIPLEELKALDASGSLNSVFEEHGDRFSAWVMGGKYYCIKVMFEFADVYTYDSGTFTLIDDPPVGLNIPDSIMPSVIDIDIDKAVAEMKKPSKAVTQSAAEKYINEIFNFIKEENILCGCFYDFNRDGFPELVNMQPGEAYYSYIIYDIKGETPARIGTITVNDTEYADIEFSLYKDKNSGELFCLGQSDTIFWGQNKNDITDINIFKFKNGHIETERVGSYSHRYNSDDPLKIYIGDNYFMDCQAEAGEYNRSELPDVLGISGYLSQFEKIEKIMLEKEWNYDDWETVRTAVTKALNTNSPPM